MQGLSLIIVATAVAIGFLVLGMSLTLILRGHHIRSEIADNPEMKKRGIRCAAEEMRALENGNDDASGCAAGDCTSCGKSAPEACGKGE